MAGKPVAYYPQDPDPATPNLVDGLHRSEAVAAQGAGSTSRSSSPTRYLR